MRRSPRRDARRRDSVHAQREGRGRVALIDPSSSLERKIRPRSCRHTPRDRGDPREADLLAERTMSAGVNPSNTAHSARGARARDSESRSTARHRARDEALRAFRDGGVECEVVATEAPGHATDLARSAARVRRCLHAGRRWHCWRSSPRWRTASSGGHTPRGTGNILVRSLGIRCACDAPCVPPQTRRGVHRPRTVAPGRHFAIGLGVWAGRGDDRWRVRS